MKTGDYVRTKEGYICKILEIHDEYSDDYLDWNDIHSASIRKSHVVKNSLNIIDLIQEGDYVNGYLIEKVYDVFETSPNKLKEAHIKYADEDFISQLYDTEIKSIVTKEQFESIQYEVK